jgi:hypothetical protein
MGDNHTSRDRKEYLTPDIRYRCWRKVCQTAASGDELEENFCILLSLIQPTAELLEKLTAFPEAEPEDRVDDRRCGVTNRNGRAQPFQVKINSDCKDLEVPPGAVSY